MRRSLGAIAVLVTIAACSSTTAQPPADASALEGGNDTGAACCTSAVNASAATTGAPFSNVWLAWRFVPSCALTPRSLWIASDAPAATILADNNGEPGTILAMETPSVRDATGIKVSLPPSALAPGVPIWIAIKNALPGYVTDGSLSPFAPTGTTSTETASTNQSLTGPWVKGSRDRPVFTISDCP